ncbi:acyl carrier protein [Paenibacillus apiarius]|uniref:Acyl carrier protein n=1 Tax=Paenibacillus apiarius TaxID=46240 RepID=A0ABT4DLP9_9BACL|nr:acyl carrier protein [Paenibacillus apiarius]MBN3526101.1 acyl carrier protein [Paenibacillus apiarius]MCY9513726.1 acyl carrier protein [Paenibacillus apiarius]MCY9518277.1 acyl carrier protein [Paenibacillus apiarius]MCY9551322.1 acyl carrier protein [Paenibacillus apiarius]MCY9558476.1 acyl carrier protein [Paenibacillus apiarius]
MEIKQKIRGFIESNLVVFEDEAVFSDDDHIFQMGFVNSLFAMKLLGYIEQEFGITVGNEDLDIANFSTLNNIVRLIEKHKQEV